MAHDSDAGVDLVQALGIDPASHDRDLLWSLVRHVEADLDDGSVQDLVSDLVRDPSVDPVVA